MRHVGPRLVCAATYHRRALCRFPLLRHGALHSNFALARLARGDRAGAIRQLMIAVEVDIENKEAWANLGIVLSENGRHVEAVAAFVCGRSSAPLDTMLCNSQGVALVDLGKAYHNCPTTHFLTFDEADVKRKSVCSARRMQHYSD